MSAARSDLDEAGLTRGGERSHLVGVAFGDLEREDRRIVGFGRGFLHRQHGRGDRSAIRRVGGTSSPIPTQTMRN